MATTGNLGDKRSPWSSLFTALSSNVFQVAAFGQSRPYCVRQLDGRHERRNEQSDNRYVSFAPIPGNTHEKRN
jgi:hypothetical protein